MVMEISINHSSDNLSRTGLHISSKKVIGYYSVNEKGVYCTDAKQLKYVRYRFSDDEIRVKFNLYHMQGSMIKKDPESMSTWNRLNHMFIWISLNSSRLLKSNEVIFVTFRGNLTKIMCSPYEVKDDWIICAKYNSGIIYLNYFETESNIRQKETTPQFALKCEYWGRKFEQFVTSDNPKTKPNTNKVLNENEEFDCVFDRELCGHRTIYGAEMDCIVSHKLLDLKDSNNDLTKFEFVELKTSRKISNFNQDKNFRRYKLLKWWCQSYLVGIKTVMCGFRDDHGVVHRLKCYKVEEMPKLANGLWKKEVCLNFLDKFLKFVKQVVLESVSSEVDDVWKFQLYPKLKVTAEKITDNSSRYKSGFRRIAITNME